MTCEIIMISDIIVKKVLKNQLISFRRILLLWCLLLLCDVIDRSRVVLFTPSGVSTTTSSRTTSTTSPSSPPTTASRRGTAAPLCAWRSQMSTTRRPSSRRCARGSRSARTRTTLWCTWCRRTTQTGTRSPTASTVSHCAGADTEKTSGSAQTTRKSM